MTLFNWMQVLAIALMAVAQLTLGFSGAPSSLCVLAGFLAAWIPLMIPLFLPR